MNDLMIAAVPFAAFVALFFVWLVQTRKQEAALRAMRQESVAPVAAPQTTRPEMERAGVQIPA